MAKLIRIDEFGTYVTTDDLYSGIDVDEEDTKGRTEDEYIISNDNRINGK